MRIAAKSLLYFLLLLAGLTFLSNLVNAQTLAPAPVPYQYFAESGASYDWIGKTPAVNTGFGLRLGTSNVFSISTITSTVTNGQTTASLNTGLEYHFFQAGGWEFFGIGNAGAVVTGSATLANFSGGVGISYDIGALITKNKFSLLVVPQCHIVAITATEVKPSYFITFRKTF